jgi:hypothetical protein
MNRTATTTFQTLALTVALFLPTTASLPAERYARDLKDPVTQENSVPDNPPARVARLSYLSGSVSFLRAGIDQWAAAAPNFPVTTGDRVYTDRGARADLELGDATVHISGHTDLTVTNLNDQLLQLGLDQGTLRISVYRLPSGQTLEVDAPNGALTIRQPGEFRVDVDPEGDFTQVAVNRGSVEVTGGGVSQVVEPGQAVELTGHDQVFVASLPFPRLDDFDKWCENRDRHISSSASARYVSPDIPGFDDMDDYGEWEEVAEYGPIWYPTGVAVEWVPYRFGRWVWVGPWGWTWVEDEPWGFCPFHYGRWVHIGVRWGWLPGPVVPVPVYAPAFVAFVGGPNFSITIGGGPVSLTAWFPLGPGEPFFPWYHCRDEYIRQVNITNIRTVTNINFVNITKIENVHYVYRTVATTAVPENVFRSGQPVARQVVRLSPQQLEHARIVPHPAVNPTMRAALAGNPVKPPPVRTPSALTTARAAPGRLAESTRNAPTSLTPSRTPASVPRSAAPQKVPRVAPQSRWIMRTPPPPPHVPFTLQRQFMPAHPGRPLEPQQLANIRAGRPVGPMLDHEFPPHVAPFPASRPRRP